MTNETHLNSLTLACDNGTLVIDRVCTMDEEGNNELNNIRFACTVGPHVYSAIVRGLELGKLYSGGVYYDSTVLLDVLAELGETKPAIAHQPGIGTWQAIVVQWKIPITLKTNGIIKVVLPLIAIKLNGIIKAVPPLIKSSFPDENPPPAEKKDRKPCRDVQLEKNIEDMQLSIVRLAERVKELENKIDSQDAKLLAPKDTDKILPAAASKTVPGSRPASDAAVRDTNPCDVFKESISRPGTDMRELARMRLEEDDPFFIRKKLSYPSLVPPIDEITHSRIKAVYDGRSFLGYVLAENAEEMRWRFANLVAIRIANGASKLIAMAEELNRYQTGSSDRDYDFHRRLGSSMYELLPVCQRHSIRVQYAMWRMELERKGL